VKSIRRRLLQSLLLGMTLIASGTGVLLYHHVRSELDELYNAHLSQVALFMANEWQYIDPSPLYFPPIKLPARVRWEEEDYLIQLWSRDGVLLTQQIPAITNAHIPLYPNPGFFRKRINNESWRIYRADSAHAIVQIAQPEFARTDTIAETSVKLLAPLALQVPLLIFVGWISVRQGLKPLQALSRAIAQRQPNALTAVDDSAQPQELRPLVTTLNDLLARLNAALEQQRHFVADAAHELRTPIAALQLQLDLLQRAADNHERDQAVLQLRAGLNRATHLTQQLLSIARAESGPQQTSRSDVDLAPVIETIMERHLPLARLRQLDLGVARLEPLAIRCARADIETVLDNLVGNAIRYTPRGGRIDISAYRDRDRAILEVSDSGPGIADAEKARVFDRFYRVLQNNPGSDAVEGSGLGLAIVKTICNRYNADIEISDGINGCGTRVSVSWPLDILLIET
jgi:two-component system OmpR family sensor kinase